MDSTSADRSRATNADRSRVRLSTGHTIALPLELSFTVGGVTVPARRDRLADVLPAGLSPLAIAPGIGCVTLAGIHYHRVGGSREHPDRGLEPYDEFAAIVPAVRGGWTSLPGVQLVGGEVGGYVHWLPVTTDASVALGREIWGYPKERAAITVTDGPRGLRTVVGGDGGGADVVRLEVSRPRVDARGDWTLWSYTMKDDELLRTRAEVRGRIGLGSPIGATVSVAPELAEELGLWQRPLARLYGRQLRARLAAGEPVDTTGSPTASTDADRGTQHS